MQNEITEYLAWKGTYAPRASINYRIWLMRFVEMCGEKSLEEYTIADYIHYHKQLERKYSPYCLQYSGIVIKNFFQYFQHQGRKAGLDPWLIKLPRIKANSHRAVTESEFEKIISQIPENEFHLLRNLVMIRLLWDTGVRVSELCELPVSAVSESTAGATITTKKTGNIRMIFWSEETHRLLIKYLGIRGRLPQATSGAFLFVGQAKRQGWSLRITPYSLQRYVKAYARKAGIKEKVTPHSFRHGWAHKRRDQLAPLAFIQRGLGHSDPASTFVYEQYSDNDFASQARRYLNAKPGVAA